MAKNVFLILCSQQAASAVKRSWILLDVDVADTMCWLGGNNPEKRTYDVSAAVTTPATTVKTMLWWRYRRALVQGPTPC